MSRAALRAAVLCVVLGAAGCALFATQEGPMPAAVIAAPGERFTIVLRADPESGYRWTLGKPPDEAVVQLVETTFAAGGEPGAEGEERWVFEAVAPGWTTIELVYQGPEDQGLAPARIATYSVDVR